MSVQMVILSCAISTTLRRLFAESITHIGRAHPVYQPQTSNITVRLITCRIKSGSKDQNYVGLIIFYYYVHVDVVCLFVYLGESLGNWGRRPQNET
jgi:hypothetical protein